MPPASESEPITSAKVHLFMPASLRAQMREVASAHDRPLSREIRRALVEYIDRHGPEAAEE